MVPLRDRSGALLGFLWADDPVDLLLPGIDDLRALRAFANHAVGAIEAARAARAACATSPSSTR